MTEEKEGMPTIQDLALWIGDLTINLRMAYKTIDRLKKEIEELKGSDSKE